MSEKGSSNRDSATFKVVPAAATVAAAPTKRASSGPSKAAAVKPPTTIHPSAIVADKAVLTGSHHIKIGANTVIHPFARIISSTGPVTIGENVIVNERAVVGIIENGDEAFTRDSSSRSVLIGDGVTIESSAVVEATAIGEGSIIDIEARVGIGANVGQVSHELLYVLPLEILTDWPKYCKLSPKASVGAYVVVEDFMTIAPPDYRRPDHLLKFNPSIRTLKLKRQKDQVELLRRLIPSNLAKWS
ncbi:MAG: hypothetical protein M1821_006062 [Bathelium mastoideum]|nr:MAG: hypothetical protein M1821_006062 [Bathelium mastoideum]KAI9688405.1 MAG: hypothetical protein M1822_001354 [Bathelium mastoideum]